MSISHLPRQKYREIKSRSNPSALHVLRSNICLDGMQNMLENCGSFLMTWALFCCFFSLFFRCLTWISLKATKMNFKGIISQTLSKLLHFDSILLGLSECKNPLEVQDWFSKWKNTEVCKTCNFQKPEDNNKWSVLAIEGSCKEEKGI